MTHNKVTLITGTSKGIGKSLAEHYSRQGHRVIGCSRTLPSFTLPNYTHIVADITDEKEVLNLFQLVKSQFGHIDHLINNAGIAAMNHVLLTPLTTIQKLLATNVVGTFLMCREGGKLMAKNTFGRIVNFSTIAVPLKVAGEAMYAASKAAVHSFTEVLAHELGEYGITVNAIGPTPIETDLVRSVPKAKLEKLIHRQAIKRFGEYSDVANVTDFFLQKSSQFITGQILYLGGIA